MTDDFKEKFTFAQRSCESSRIMKLHPTRIPIIIEKSDKCTQPSIKNIDKRKYLVPKDMTIGQFMYVVRKRISLAPHEAVFIFTQTGTIPCTSTSIENIYNQDKNDDGFLYLSYSGENTFGI